MKRKVFYTTMLIGLLLAGSVVGFGCGISQAAKPGEASVSAGTPMIPASFSDLAEKVRPGVVNIQVVKKVASTGLRNFPGNPFGFGGSNPFEDFFEQFERNQPERKQQGVGSGFVMSRDGYILTNNHVVEGADEIKVKLSDGKELTGKVVGRDPKTDIAVVKIDGPADLHPLTLGDSDKLKVGDWVMAVGSPFGLEQTVTAGIVSAKGRVIGSGPYDDFIQTDASINPGNSGGPLVNMQGEVVGINTAIIASGQGIGFAIPIAMAKEIAPQLQEKGHVTRGLLGVGIQDITPELAKSFGLKESKGALVAQVVPDGPADKAGIEQGDVIMTFDGKPVADSKELPRIVASTPVGKSVKVKVLRDGKEVDFQVSVGEMEAEAAEKGKTPTQASLGISAQTITPEMAQELGLKGTEGVVVTRVAPGSAAAEALVRTGDVIREVNRKPVKNADDFARKIGQAKEKDGVLLLIQRGKNRLYVAVTPK
jgi:serine protease Do